MQAQIDTLPFRERVTDQSPECSKQDRTKQVILLKKGMNDKHEKAATRVWHQTGSDQDVSACEGVSKKKQHGGARLRFGAAS